MARVQQERVTRDRTQGTRHDDPDVADPEKAASRPRAEAAKVEADALLDEIDAILDENEEFQNAQAFVDAYRQKGGE
jgi:ribosome assembly protein YihI (activator of Der GTPase)